MASVAKREWTAPSGEKKSAYIVRYKSGGKHCGRQFERKKDAEAFKQKVEREIHDGVHVASTDAATVATVCDAFIKWQEDRVRQGAIGRGRLANVKKSIDLNIVPLLGQRKIHQLKAAELEKWFHDIVRAGLSPQTARIRLEDVRQLFRFATRNGFAKVNPVPEAIAELGRIPRVKIKTFSLEQIGAILKACEERPKRFRERSFRTTRCMVHLAACCGLRLGEIRALRLQHVRFDKGVIEVRHSFDGWDDIKGPKSEAGVRDVPMPAHVAAMLRDKIEHDYIENDLGLVITTMYGEPLTTGSFRPEIWYPLLKRVGLYSDVVNDKGRKEQYHFHALRHFASSYWLANKLSMQDVAELMGHGHFDLTLRVYAHGIASPEYRSKAFETMATQLLPAPKTIEGTVSDTQELHTAR